MLNITQIMGFPNTILPALPVCEDTEDAQLARLQWPQGHSAGWLLLLPGDKRVCFPEPVKCSDHVTHFPNEMRTLINNSSTPPFLGQIVHACVNREGWQGNQMEDLSPGDQAWDSTAGPGIHLYCVKPQRFCFLNRFLNTAYLAVSIDRYLLP